MMNRFCSHTIFDWKQSQSRIRWEGVLGSDIRHHLTGKETITSWCALGETEQLCACHERLSQCKAEAQFNSFTILSKLHFVCCREFQTEYLLCDCNILWMHRWVKERNITVRDTRCAYPKSLQAQPVTGVKQELLTCGKEEQLRKG